MTFDLSCPRFHRRALFAICGFWLGATALAEPPPSGDAVIRGAAGGSEIVITTTARCAGAIHSLTWKGKEFIDSHDHGRQLQSASNFDFGTPILDETFNPTEAGSSRDAMGEKSTSRLKSLHAAGNTLETETQMAFWLNPGERSERNLAKNQTALSDHVLTKRVRIGYKDLPHVISYDVSFKVPATEKHKEGVFEALTGYMPPEFSEFTQFNLKTGMLEPLDVGPGEIEQPIVFSVPGGSHAMAIYAPPQPAPQTTGPTFGRFTFAVEKVVKWNCVFRVSDPAGLRAGEYPFRMFVVVGDLATVTDSLRALRREFSMR